MERGVPSTVRSNRLIQPSWCQKEKCPLHTDHHIHIPGIPNARDLSIGTLVGSSTDLAILEPGGFR